MNAAHCHSSHRMGNLTNEESFSKDAILPKKPTITQKNHVAATCKDVGRERTNASFSSHSSFECILTGVWSWVSLTIFHLCRSRTSQGRKHVCSLMILLLVLSQCIKFRVLVLSQKLSPNNFFTSVTSGNS